MFLAYGNLLEAGAPAPAVVMPRGQHEKKERNEQIRRERERGDKFGVIGRRHGIEPDTAAKIYYRYKGAGMTAWESRRQAQTRRQAG